MAVLDDYAGMDGVFKRILADFFWNWYRENANTYNVPVKFWIFKKVLPLSAFHPLFELLFGPEPYSE